MTRSPRPVRTRRWPLALVVTVLALILPAQAMALRYASPTGMSSNDCQTPATACDLTTAIQGDGAANNPTNGEEVIVLGGGSYTLGTQISDGAGNLNIHGEVSQSQSFIDATSGGSILIDNGSTLSNIGIEGGSPSAIILSGGNLNRVFAKGATTGNTPVCQCYLGTLRNSVFVATASGPAAGINSNAGDATMTYRNVTAYSTSAAGSALGVTQIGTSGTLTFTGINLISVNVAGGTDVIADGRNNPGSGGTTITLEHSDYNTISEPDGGDVIDAGGQQTGLPLFTNPTTNDFSELAGSPTIDTGVTDPLNGTLDFAGNPRTIDGMTDIGAYEYVPAAPPIPEIPGVTPPAPAPPAFAVGKTKVKINGKGKGRLGFTCISAAGGICDVTGTLSAAGKAKRGTVGQVSGSVPTGSSGRLRVKLNKAGRQRLADAHKLQVQLSGAVRAGTAAALAASLKLVPKD